MIETLLELQIQYLDVKKTLSHSLHQIGQDMNVLFEMFFCLSDAMHFRNFLILYIVSVTCRSNVHWYARSMAMRFPYVIVKNYLHCHC